jgi:hypothetical protein
MTQVINVRPPIVAELPKAISNLDLMKLIFKINSQIDKFSSAIGDAKRNQLNIFMDQSKSHKKLKMSEGASVLSLAILSGVAGVSSHFAQGLVQTALKTATQITPFVSQGTQSVFSSYEQLITAKKYSAQTDAESSRSTDEKLARQVSSNTESLAQILRMLGSLNQLR